MFAFKSKTKGIIEAITKADTKSVNDTIEEIHDAFDTASERALTEAKAIIDGPSHSDQEKIDLMKRIGMPNNPLVKNLAERDAKKQAAKNRADIVMRYQMMYPHLKIIFLDQVTAICEKYGLVCGDISKYIGDVPMKNLKEISEFKLFPEDIRYQRSIYSKYMHNVVTSPIEYSSTNHYNSQRSTTCAQLVVCDLPAEIKEDAVHIDDNIRFLGATRSPFAICAPAKDMDTTRTVTKGVFITDIPDPIVLYPQKDCFIIVSKWGLEASDPLVVNEKMN